MFPYFLSQVSPPSLQRNRNGQQLLPDRPRCFCRPRVLYPDHFHQVRNSSVVIRFVCFARQVVDMHRHRRDEIRIIRHSQPLRRCEITIALAFRRQPGAAAAAGRCRSASEASRLEARAHRRSHLPSLPLTPSSSLPLLPHRLTPSTAHIPCPDLTKHPPSPRYLIKAQDG